MISASLHDVESAFLSALADAGLSPAEALDVVFDGQIHRFTVDGDKRKSDNGWFVLFDGDVPSGAFGSWKTGQSHTWCSRHAESLTPEEKAEWKRKQSEAAKARQQEQLKVRADARARAEKLLGDTKPATNQHAYLAKKNVAAYGVRRLGEQLVVPMRDSHGILHSLQFIGPDGGKKFLTGGQVDGCYYAIGKPDELLCVAEGYATGATIHAATGFAVAVAFNSGNLLPVARALRAKFPELRILVCADNDRFTLEPVENPGVTAAKAVSIELGAPWVAPSFEDVSGKPTDFNDLQALCGLDEVRKQIMSSLDNVVTLRSAVARREFEDLIAGESDFDVLTGRIAGLIRRSRDLTRVGRDTLLKLIAKKTDAPLASLKKEDRRDEFRLPPPGGEEASVFMAELNARHAIVPVGGSVYVMNVEHDPVLDRRLITYSRPSDFVLRYQNRKTFHGGDFTNVAAAWLDRADRRQFAGVIFEPGRDRPGYFNLFEGWGVEPQPGNCSSFMDLISSVICDGNRDSASYVWHWLAHLFQKPCELPGVALVLRGGRGTGKNTFVDAIGRLVGRAHYLPLASMQQVTGRFSGHLADAILVFPNEAIWGGDKQAEGALKQMITDSITPIERKGKDIISAPNYKRVMIATNEDWAVPVGMDERRFCILDVSDAHQQDRGYFKAIWSELEAGGFEALLHHLLATDLSEFDPRFIPESLKSNGWDMKIRSANTVEQWWFSCLDNGYMRLEEIHGEGEFPRWFSELSKPETHGLYLRWCERHKIPRPELDGTFGKHLLKMGIGDGRPWKGGSSRCRVYKFPELDLAREIFSRYSGVPLSYWGEDTSKPEASE